MTVCQMQDDTKDYSKRFNSKSGLFQTLSDAAHRDLKAHIPIKIPVSSDIPTLDTSVTK